MTNFWFDESVTYPSLWYFAFTCGNNISRGLGTAAVRRVKHVMGRLFASDVPDEWRRNYLIIGDFERKLVSNDKYYKLVSTQV